MYLNTSKVDLYGNSIEGGRHVIMVLLIQNDLQLLKNDVTYVSCKVGGKRTAVRYWHV